jgi:hypothetical protein
MIWLRTMRYETEDVFAMLLDYARQVVSEPGLVDVHVYGSAGRPTDLAVSLGGVSNHLADKEAAQA